jgi:serine/threonine protein kinase
MEFVAGALPQAPARDVESHMARCSDCRRLIVEIAKANAIPDTDVDEQKPQGSGGSSNSWSSSGSEGSSGAPLHLHRGARIQRYTLLYRLGVGGMGSVHAAFDPKLDRRVALKFLRTDLVRSHKQSHRERLVREARALARLSHANVVSIFDVVETEGSVFLAMELIEGSNARIWRELGNRSTQEIMKIYDEALSALIAAHDQGIIHRDFKPDNIMVGADGIARVTDFGLARASAADMEELLAEVDSRATTWERLTQTGLVLGTPRYMAPEQFSGVANELTDQFSFCLSTYESLYGHYPLGTNTPRKLDPNRPIEEQLLAPLSKGQVPEPLRRILLRGMAVNPQERWPSLRELQYELNQVLGPKRSGAAQLVGFGGVAAVAAMAAFYFAPSPPPAAIPDQSAELQQLKRDVVISRAAADELIQLQQAEIDDLRRRLKAQQEASLPPVVEPEKPPVARTRPPARPLGTRIIERSVTTRLAEVLACYEGTVTDADEITIEATVAVDELGKVQFVSAPYHGDRRTNRCLKQALMKLEMPAASTATKATLLLSFFRLDTGHLAVNMQTKTRQAALGQVTVDSKGRFLVDCPPSDPLCGLE